MTDYINYLSEGFNNGLNRDIILSQAADHYANKWGSNYVIKL